MKSTLFNDDFIVRLPKPDTETKYEMSLCANETLKIQSVDFSEIPLGKSVLMSIARDRSGLITKTYEFTTVSFDKHAKKSRFGIRPRMLKNCRLIYQSLESRN